MTRVSIIMPVYNGEKFLSEAIESILNQSFRDFEFIIIKEFGSNKQTTNILQFYAKKDDRIKIIQNSIKIGISASLNLGIDSSQGEYIVRMDGDDISMPDRLAKQVEYMDQHPEMGLSGIKPTIFGDEDWEWKAESEPDQIKTDTIFFIPVLHPTAIFRKSLFDKYELRYNPIYFCSEDYDLFTRASRCFPIGNILDPSLFMYRRYNSAATYKNKLEGDRVCKSILNENLNLLGLELTDDEISLLYIHTGLVGLKGDRLKNQLIHLDLLLKKIFQANLHIQIYDSIALWKTLHKRWLHAYDIIRYANYVNEELVEEEIKFLWKNSAFSNQNVFLPFRGDESIPPGVSVVMSLYNGENYLYEAIFSIITQTYHDWELLIIMDPSTDNSELIVNEFTKHNARVILYKNTERLGLARTLNRGIDLSRGDYVARIDDDDIALPQRFEKQVAFLDSHPDISLVSSWQHHFGDRDSIHNPPEKHEQIKAALLFRCDVCHTTIMFRKNDFNKNNLCYDPSYLSEDYELWTRAIHKIKFATIQEVLGEYRWNGSNITSTRIQTLDIEARKLVARTLKKYLSIRLSDDDNILVAGWSNPFMDYSRPDLIELRKRHERLLLNILRQNKKLNVFDQKALEEEVNKRLDWANGKKDVFLINNKESRNKSVDILKKFVVLTINDRKTLKEKSKARLTGYPIALVLAKTTYKFLRGVKNVITFHWLRSLKMRLLPPSSRSFHAFVEKYNIGIGLLNQNIYELLDRLDKQNKKLEEQNKLLGDLNGRLDDQGRQLGDLNGRLDDQGRQLGDLNGRLDDQGRQLGDLNGRLDDQGRQLGDLNGRLVEQDNNLKEYNFGINQIKQNIYNVKNDITSFQIDVLEDIYKKNGNEPSSGSILLKEAGNKNVLFVNDTYDDFHHGSCGTSFILRERLESTFGTYESIPIEEIRKSVNIPQNFDEFLSDSFFKSYVDNNEKIAGQIEASDIILVNGEGCLSYFPWNNNLLYLIYISKVRFNKYVVVINTSLYESNYVNGENNNEFRKMLALILNKIDFIAVREYKSIINISDVTFRNLTLSFDCLPLYIHKHYNKLTPIQGEYVVISGGNYLPKKYEEFIVEMLARMPSNLLRCKLVFLISAVKYGGSETGDLPHFNRLASMIGDGNIELYTATSIDEWLSVIDNASLLVSGRFHHSIAAFMLDTPFLTFQSDTQKVESILDMMGMHERLLQEPDINYVISLLNKETFYLKNDNNVKQHLLNLAENNFNFIKY